MVGWHETEIAGFRQARLYTPCPTLLREPAESCRLPVPICSSDRSPLSICFKFFRTWALAHNATNAIVTSELTCVVGEDRETLGSAHGRNEVNESIIVWIALVKGIKRDKTLSTRSLRPDRLRKRGKCS